MANKFCREKSASGQSNLNSTDEQSMFGLARLAKPFVRAASVPKSGARVAARPQQTGRSLGARYSHQPAPRNFKRLYCTSKQHEDDAPQGILTVDKLGVQRDASEMASPKGSKTSYTHGAPATEMPIFEVTRLNIQETLASQSPVIIMAYMPGNELSNQLAERLTSRVMDLDGLVRLGRLNASVEQELAVALKLTQLPTVLGVYGGRMVNSFVGVPDDAVLEQFMELMLRVGGQNQLVEMYSKANEALEKGLIAEARVGFQEVLNATHLRAEAIALSGLIRCAVQEGKIEEAQELAEVIKNSFPRDVPAPEVQQAFTALELVSSATTGGSGATIDELKQKIAEDSNNMDARLELATALWAASQQANAINALLDMIKIDKHWNDQAARKLLLKFWDTLGPEHPLTSSSRKRFGMIWF